MPVIQRVPADVFLNGPILHGLSKKPENIEYACQKHIGLETLPLPPSDQHNPRPRCSPALGWKARTLLNGCSVKRSHGFICGLLAILLQTKIMGADREHRARVKLELSFHTLRIPLRN